MSTMVDNWESENREELEKFYVSILSIFPIKIEYEKFIDIVSKYSSIENSFRK